MIAKQLLKQFCVYYNARNDHPKRAGLLDWMRRFGTEKGSVRTDVGNQIAHFNSRPGNDKITVEHKNEMLPLITKAFEHITR